MKNIPLPNVESEKPKNQLEIATKPDSHRDKTCGEEENPLKTSNNGSSLDNVKSSNEIETLTHPIRQEEVNADDTIFVDYVRFPLTETGFVYPPEDNEDSANQSEMDQNISKTQVLYV